MDINLKNIEITDIIAVLQKGGFEMNLKELRKKSKMTQKELADKIGVSISVISRYEAGVIIPSEERVKEIAEALNVPEEEIEVSPSFLEVNNSVRLDCINRILKYTALLRAKGHCELCGCQGPFNYNGAPYLKVHKLSENPSLANSVDNYAALCPNCYEKVRLLNKSSDLTIIREKIKRNMEEA